MQVFSEHPWQIWRFRALPRAELISPPMLRNYFDSLAPDLGVQKLGDWRNVSFRQLVALGPCTHVKQMGLCVALKAAYPEHNWNTNSPKDGFVWAGNLLTSQHYLACLLREYVTKRRM
jgi:hypothetical protein